MLTFNETVISRQSAIFSHPFCLKHLIAVSSRWPTGPLVVEILLEIEFVCDKVRKFRHQLADYSFSFHTSYTHLSHTNIKNFIFTGENVIQGVSK